MTLVVHEYALDPFANDTSISEILREQIREFKEANPNPNDEIVVVICEIKYFTKTMLEERLVDLDISTNELTELMERNH